MEFGRGDIGLLVRFRWVVARCDPGVRQLVADQGEYAPVWSFSRGRPGARRRRGWSWSQGR